MISKRPFAIFDDYAARWDGVTLRQKLLQRCAARPLLHERDFIRRKVARPDHSKMVQPTKVTKQSDRNTIEDFGSVMRREEFAQSELARLNPAGFTVERLGKVDVLLHSPYVLVEVLRSAKN